MTDATTTSSATLHFTADNFQKTLDEAGEKPVMVDFYADWCGPCQIAGPVVERLAEQHKADMIVGKLDVDAHNAIAAQYQVRSIPTVLVFKKGEVVDRLTGFAGEAGYVKMIDKALAA